MALHAPKSGQPAELATRTLPTTPLVPVLAPGGRQQQAVPTGPFGVTIHEVQGLDSPYLPVAVELFNELFPHQQHYLPQLYEAVQEQVSPRTATLDHVWVLEQQGYCVGLRMVSYLPARNIGYGAFIGVAPAYRSRGLGAWLVEQTQAQLCRDAASYGNSWHLGYCAEVAPISGAADDHERELRTRRLNFHLRCGAVILDIAYLEPAAFSATGTQLEPARPMQLVFYPLLSNTCLSRSDLLTIVEGLYLDVYKLPPDSWYMQRAIDSIERSR